MFSTGCPGTHSTEIAHLSTCVVHVLMQSYVSSSGPGKHYVHHRYIPLDSVTYVQKALVPGKEFSIGMSHFKK